MSAAPPATPGKDLPRARFAWALFDWAGQPYFTLVNTFVFAPYFASRVASDPVTGQAQWGWAIAFTGMAIAIIAPLLGAHADRQADTRRLLFLFSAMLVLGACGLWIAVPGYDAVWLVLAIVVVGNLGAECLLVLVNAMLPAISRQGAMGRLGGGAWALGYLGGLIALAIMLALFVAEPEPGTTIAGIKPLLGLDPQTGAGARAAGPFTALWFIVFAWPLFVAIPAIAANKPPRQPKDERSLVSAVIADMAALARERGPMLRFLVGRMLYQDGLNALFVFGGIYAAGTFGWTTTELGIFGILIIVTATAGSLAGGYADDRFGAKITVLVSLAGLFFTGLLIFSITSDSVFFVVPVASGEGSLFGSVAEQVYLAVALVLGLFAGPVQSASRTLLVRLSPPEKMAQNFGFYALTGKITAFAAPAAVALVTTVSGSQRIGMSVILVFFAAGFWFLKSVPDLRDTSRP